MKHACRDLCGGLSNEHPYRDKPALRSGASLSRGTAIEQDIAREFPSFIMSPPDLIIDHRLATREYRWALLAT